ncbi:MAG: hypothetical protein QXD13_02175 [Candidatus Pacearchaeota archaeon]
MVESLEKEVLNHKEKLSALTDAYYKAKSERILRINASIEEYRKKVLYAGLGTMAFAGVAVYLLYYFMTR